jgi:hypothetical protein
MGWEEHLEEEYLKFAGVKYPDTTENGEPDKTKGCVARMMIHCIKEIRKGVNRAGKNSHGFILRLKRKPEEISPGTRYKKRIKGTTLGAFYTKYNDCIKKVS